MGIGLVKPSAVRRPLTGMARRRALERIELLCSCGVGLEAIASPFCATVRDLLGSDAGSLFWLDAQGRPAGFYHSNAPADLKDIYIAQIDERFLLSEPVNIVSLCDPAGPPIGEMLDEVKLAAFWTGAIYRHLCAPLGHRYLFDMRVDGGPNGRAVFVAWNIDGQPFDPADVDRLAPVRPMMEAALRERESRASWRSTGDGTAHLITSLDGALLKSIGAEAERVLMRSHLLGQDVPMTSAPRTAPGFCRLLAAQLAGGETARLALPVADGRLVMIASRTRLLGTSETVGMFIALDLQEAKDVAAIDRLIGLQLTPYSAVSPFTLSRADHARSAGRASASAMRR